MKLNSKLTWGLAWTGLALVVAVPSADFLTGKMGGNTAALVSPADAAVATPTAVITPEPVKTAAVTTRTTKTGVTIIPAGTDIAAAGDPVDKFIKAGKPLPDYISGAAAKAPGLDQPVTTQVAAIDPVVPAVAPMPFPAWARPHDAARLATTKPVAAKPIDPVVVVDDAQQAAIDTPDISPMPPAGIADDNAQSWKQARLNRYLERQGLIDDQGRSSVSVTTERASNYDPDGFYLSDGPNGAKGDRARRKARIEQMFADDYSDDDSYGFTLF